MTIVNHAGEGYNPFHVDDEMVPVGQFAPDEHAMHRRIDADNMRLDAEFDKYIAGGRAGTLSLAAYEHWSERAWKTPHGSYETVTRLNNKIDEELGELDRALEKGDRHGITSEMGDILWCANASAANGAVDVESSLKPLLYDYAMGIARVDEGAVELPWRDTALELAARRGRITGADIDALIGKSFEPLMSTAMYLYDDEPLMGKIETWSGLLVCLSGIKAVSEQLYDYGEGRLAGGEDKGRLRRQLGILCAGTLLHVAYLARLYDTSFDAAVAENVRKLEGRLSLNLTDKSDGPRPADLL